MASERRFTLTLVGWALALTAALAALVWTFGRTDLVAARLVAGGVAGAMLVGLLRHVDRTNLVVARFVEALRHDDFQARFATGGGAGFDALGRELSEVMRRLKIERARAAEELRFWEAVVDDAPIALLIADRSQVRPVNKAARRLFDRDGGTRAEDYAAYGEGLLRHIAGGGTDEQEIVPLRLAGGEQRAVVRAASLVRLGEPVRVVAVEPVQAALDALEIGTQTDLVRVLTHEILNSLTPVTSLAGTVAVLLGEEEPDMDEARAATLTLARRAESLRRFIDSYRAIARLPEPRRRQFAAEPFAAELARLFAAEWIDHRLEVTVTPALVLDADPDLLAQLLINLLRNAAQATDDGPADDRAGGGRVRLAIAADGGGGVAIEVADDGSGIAEGARGDIFLPFFTTRRSGTGIGLNLVRQIVVAHGWRIEVGSSDLGGAAFRISAPAAG